MLEKTKKILLLLKDYLPLYNLYIDTNFVSFEQLVQKCNRKHFYRYLQLINFINYNSTNSTK